MNGQTITTKDLLSEITLIEKALFDLKKKILSFAPPKYGSDEWWEKSIERAKKDVAAKRYKTFHSGKDFVRYLNSISR